MSIRKPLKKEQQKMTADLDDIIAKGAPVRSDSKEASKKEWSHIHLRIPTDMLEKIDQLLENTVALSRTGWILQTLNEKIQKNEI